MLNRRRRQAGAIRSAALFLREQAHEAGRGHVRGEESGIFQAGAASQRFSSEVSAADGAFHGGGPAGGGPVAGKKDARPRGGGVWAVGVDSGTRRVGGVEFFDHGGLYEIGLSGTWKEFANLAKREIDDIGAGFVDQSFRGADDQFDVASVGRRVFGCVRVGCVRVVSPRWGFFLFVVRSTACAVGGILSPLHGWGLGAHGLQAGFVKHPLDGTVEQDGVVEIGVLAVEPEVDAGYRGGFEGTEFFANRGASGSIGKDTVEVLERQSEDEIVESLYGISSLIFFLSPELNSHLRRIGGEGF